MLSFNLSDITIITVKNIGYWCIIRNISNSEAINLLENSVLENCGYTLKKYCLKFQSTQDSFFIIFFVIVVYIKWLIVWTPVSL